MSTTTTNLDSTFQNLMTLENQIRDLKETYDEELSTICEALLKDFPEMIEDVHIGQLLFNVSKTKIKLGSGDTISQKQFSPNTFSEIERLFNEKSKLKQ